MINKFEEWRKAKQCAAECRTLAHYHKVEDCVLRDVYALVKGILVVRVETGSSKIMLRVSDSLANSLMMFMEQMRYAYLHPRSSSARFLFAIESSPSC